MTENEQREAAKAFAEKWQGKGYEKGEHKNSGWSLSGQSMAWKIQKIT